MSNTGQPRTRPPRKARASSASTPIVPCATSFRAASGSGTQRLYSFQDLVTLRVIKSLLDTGVSLQRVRNAVEHLRDMDRPLTEVTLMSDGRGVYEADSPEAVVDLLRSGQGVFAIALDRVWDDVESALAAPKARSRRAAGGS